MKGIHTPVSSRLQELRHYCRHCSTHRRACHSLASQHGGVADPLQHFLLCLVFPLVQPVVRELLGLPAFPPHPCPLTMGKVHARTTSAASPLVASVRMGLSSLHHWSLCSLPLSILVLVCNSPELPNPTSPRFPKPSHPYTDVQLDYLLSSPPCLKAISDPQI